eukprot:m.184515 g.184515  ORF g.184515 m.184515 type:complete len:891 (+) comp16162_c0_seq1:61-2733(+)
MSGRYGGLPPEAYIEKLEDAIEKMKVQFKNMRSASSSRDERVNELIKRTRTQADQITSLQSELQVQRKMSTVSGGGSDDDMAALMREKLQVIEQQQRQLRDMKTDVELLRKTAAIADKQASELEMWREKTPLLKKLSTAVTDPGLRAEIKELCAEAQDHRVEKDSLLQIKTAQNKSLEQQLADMRRQFQQSQVHTNELLKAKDASWGIKLKKSVEAAKRDGMRGSQDALIERLSDELRRQAADNEVLRTEMAQLRAHGPGQDATSAYKEKLTRELEASKAALRRTRGEADVLSAVSSQDKEIIASQQRSLDHNDEQDKIIEQLQATCHSLQAAGHERDEKFSKLMDRLRKKEEEVIALRTTMKFSSVVFKAKAHREHDEADRKQAVLQKELTEKSKALHARDTLLEKKDMMINTQRDFSNEVFGQPLTKEEIEATLSDINDGLIQVIRDSSGVPWTLAHDTVQCVLEVLFDRLPAGKIVKAINQVMRPGAFWGINDGGKDRTTLEDAALVLAGYEDTSRTGVVLSNDDGTAVVAAVDSITKVVKEGSAAVVTNFLRNFEHPDVHSEAVEGVEGNEFSVLFLLTALYRETGRVDIRRSLCRCFHAMGHLLPEVHHLLQMTSLPLEIARDVKERGILGKDTDEDVDELKEALELAVVMLGHGDMLPAIDIEYMDVVFVTDLLLLAESDAQDERGEQIKTLALEVVLAFNLQFEAKNAFVETRRRSRQELAAYTDNIVLTALDQFAQNSKHKNITERLIKLVNRLHDPINVPEFVDGREDRTTKQNSVLKLLVDIFSNDELAHCFFRIADLQVLIDISLREIEDKEPDDPERLQFVQLVSAIAIKSAYEALEPELKNDRIHAVFEELVKDPNWNKSRMIELTSQVAREALQRM